MFNGDLTPFTQTSPAERLRMRSLYLFGERKLPRSARQVGAAAGGVAERRRAAGPGPRHAELNEAKCLELIAPIAERYPAETAVDPSDYYWTKGHGTGGGCECWTLSSRCAQNPWAIHSMIVGRWCN